MYINIKYVIYKYILYYIFLLYIYNEREMCFIIPFINLQNFLRYRIRVPKKMMCINRIMLNLMFHVLLNNHSMCRVKKT